MLTDQECKQALSKIGFKLGVSPKRISERLLSADDKNDLRNGNLSIEALECHVRVWMDNGEPDLVSPPKVIKQKVLSL